MDRYLLNQPIERMSYGWGWAWLGFCKSWKHVKEVYNMMRYGRFQFDKEGNIVNDKEHIDYSGLVPRKVYFVPAKMKYSNKCVSAWKAILGNDRRTSRQSKFQNKNGKFNIKYFSRLN